MSLLFFECFVNYNLTLNNFLTVLELNFLMLYIEKYYAEIEQMMIN